MRACQDAAENVAAKVVSAQQMFWARRLQTYRRCDLDRIIGRVPDTYEGSGSQQKAQGESDDGATTTQKSPHERFASFLDHL
jgi:hypothetical protein